MNSSNLIQPHFTFSFFCARPWRDSYSESSHAYVFQVRYSLLDSMDTSYFDFQRQMLLGPAPCTGALEAGNQMCGPNPSFSFLQENLTVWHCTRTSCPFWSGYFLNDPKCRSHSANFWISLKENCSMHSCKLCGSLKTWKFRSFLYCHIVSSLLKIFFYKLLLNINALHS